MGGIQPMNNEKQDWSQLFRESPTQKGVFTEKMKQTVIYRVEQNQRINSGFFYIVAPLIFLMICISIIPLVDHLPGFFQSQRATDTNAAMGLETVSKDGIILHYEPAKDLEFIPVTDKGLRGATMQHLPLSSVQIKETVSIDGIGKYVDYTKPDEGATPFFGFALAAHLSS